MDGNLEEILFLEKLDEPITKKNIHKVRCGLHSNIPHCCIRFYVKIWSKLFISKKLYQDTDMGPVIDSYLRLLGKYGRCNYVRCLECIISNRKNKIKKCRCN